MFRNLRNYIGPEIPQSQLDYEQRERQHGEQMERLEKDDEQRQEQFNQQMENWKTEFNHKIKSSNWAIGIAIGSALISLGGVVVSIIALLKK